MPPNGKVEFFPVADHICRQSNPRSPISTTSSPETPIVIIGAGIGGLSAAIRLAAHGRRVIVLEQNDSVGGKMGQVIADGFRWDTGPSVITMRHVFEEVFATAGRQLEDYLTLEAVNPLTRYFYPDGTVLDITRDWPQLAAQIATLEPRDVQGYLDFLAYAAKLHRITGPVFVYDQPPSWRSFLRVSPLEFFKIDPWFTLDQSIRRHIYSPQMRQLLGRFATYVGASPYQAPATLGVIADVELTGGVWYPRGGVYAIAQALQRLATELGVEIRTGQGVKQIDVTNGHMRGVTLDDGCCIDSTSIIANVDVATVYTKLLPADIATPARQAKLQRIEPSCSGYVLLLAIEKKHPQLAHHNIFFGPDYQREFADIFQRGIPPRDPTIYVAITSKSDPDHAPPGCENWFVLVNAPALDRGQSQRFDWQQEEASYREHVFDTLETFGLDVRSHIRNTIVRSPVDLAEQTGAWRGALYGISSNNAFNAFRRPHNRCPHVRGLYFAGGTTHPGGGVPMVALSGKVAAEMVLGEDRRRK